MAGYAGLLLATPTVLYEVVAYVLPGLTRSERRLLAPIIFGSSILFYLGCAPVRLPWRGHPLMPRYPPWGEGSSTKPVPVYCVLQLFWCSPFAVRPAYRCQRYPVCLRLTGSTH